MSAQVETLVEENIQDGEELNGNNDGAGMAEGDVQPAKEGKHSKKHKRVRINSKSSSDGEASPSVYINGNRMPFTKNSRKSRDGRGRGLPKKGGAGGKGVWGAPGSELMETGELKDTRDPNYDSDEQEAVKLEQVQPELTKEEVLKEVKPVLLEYLEHGDTEEVMRGLWDLNMGANKVMIPEMAISLALERHDPQRELTSRLISDLYGQLLTQEQYGKVFSDLLTNLPDLSLDTPDAPNLLGQFLARAVADDCLPPKYVASYKGCVESPLAQKAVDKAEVLLSMNHGIVRLDNVWGVGGGNRPVKYLVKRMVLLLKEYLSSNDLEEAAHCLRELDVPHFHHELVYEAMVISIEVSTMVAVEKMVKLLKHFYTIGLITVDQMRQGVKRVYDNIVDICVDVPAAYAIVEQLGQKMFALGLLPPDLYKELPGRGRKRFVSEGDGGLFKHDYSCLS